MKKIIILLLLMPFFIKGQTVFPYSEGKLLYNNGLVGFIPDFPDARGNTVGKIEVTPEPYDTNESPTSSTVGASGATYTNLITAYNTELVGSVIEIIDDEITLTAALILNKTVNGSGLATKIKGKSTKTTINLFNTAFPCITSGSNAAIEFENIHFKDPNSQTYPIFLNAAKNNFAHFINCTFDFAGQLYYFNSGTLVFDECDFLNQIGFSSIYAVYNSSAPTDGVINVNNCTINNSVVRNFIEFEKSGTVLLSELHVTNSDLITQRDVFRFLLDAVSYVNICGNKVKSIANYAGIKFGAEASGLVITGYDAYNAGTTYSIGDYCYNLGILWENINSSTGSEPTKSNTDWKPAEFTTGKIENNLVYRDVYTASGHGIFAGYGCYDMSIKNNIVTNYWWNIVVKGSNNTIQYNATGKGFKGISIFANDQLLVANNTCRCEDDSGLDYGPQATNGVGLINTEFRDNIFYTPDNLEIIFIDQWARWNPYTGVNNTFNQNIYYGDSNPRAYFENVLYNLESNLNDFKTACGDAKAEFIDPEFAGSDPLTEQYYLPTNLDVKKLKDSNNQSVGAIDIIKF